MNQPPPVLDYRHPATRQRASGRGVLLPAACMSGLIALGLVAGLVELLVVTWPDFGAALLAVPVLLGVFAFATVSVTSFRVLAGVEVRPATPRPSAPLASGRSSRA